MNLHEAWAEAQVYIYRHGCFSSAMRFHGWTCCAWVAFGRGQAIALHEWGDDISDLTGYIEKIPELDWLLLTHTNLDMSPLWELEELIPVHTISTDEEYLSQFKPSKYGAPVEVESQRHVEDFAHVQDLAYNMVYGFPVGIGASFYVDPRSVIAENVFAAILYDGDIPIRTGYCIVIDRFAFGVGGAVHPNYRGEHLGETLWPSICEFVRDHYGLDTVYHVTMPCAQPIMNRYNVPKLTTWRRWKRVANR